MRIAIRRSFRHGALHPARRGGGERGAVLVHVAVAVTGLLAFSALSIDLGVLWIARTDAQAAADAAALAGAGTLAFATSPEPADAEAAGLAVAEAHSVLGEPVLGSIVTSAVGACPPGAPEIGGTCLSVRVDRNRLAGSEVPTFFGGLVGLDALEVHATAWAMSYSANSTTCARPWALPDRWTDHQDSTAPIDTSWTPEDRYEHYDDADGLPTAPMPTPPPLDDYSAPSSTDPGSGHVVSELAGTRLRMYLGNVFTRATGNQYFNLDLPRIDPLEGQSNYRENIRSCNGIPLSIGDAVSTMPAVYWSVIALGVDELIAEDPGAYWDGERIAGSAFSVSPRLVPVVLFDPHHFAAQTRSSTVVSLRVTNMLGFFVEGREGDTTLVGIVIPMSGNHDSAAQTISSTAAFLRGTALVR